MKSLIIVLVLISTNTFAASIVCSPLNKSINRKVILNQLDGSQIKPYSTSKFELMLVDTSKNDDTLHVLVKTTGTLVTGDVDLEFNSIDKRISLTTYTDQANSGTLIVENNNPLKLNCTIH
jgi:hypothetical protein